MPDREKVLKGLESLRDICNAKADMAVGKGKIAWAGYANTAADALALLKEQEPRVLTLEEMKTFVDMTLDDTEEHDPKWVEFIDYEPWQRHWRTPLGVRDFLGWAGVEEYGKTWRCWDKRPTDEQRRAVKWE